MPPARPAGAQPSTKDEGSTAASITRVFLLAALALVLALAGCASPDDEGAAETGEATIAFDFEGVRAEDPQHIEQDVSYDPGDRPTMQLYESTDAERADTYTVHDLVAGFEDETGTAIDVQHEEGLGYQLAAVDGTPSEDASAFWALYVDGERETAGIGTVAVEDGSTYEWRLQERTTDDETSRQPTTGDEDASSDPGSEEGGTGNEGSTSDDGTRQATFIVDYNGFRSEDPQRTEDVVTYDPDARPTMPLYEDADTDRPDAYVLHDLVSDWSNQTGVDHIAREDGDSGFRLNTVDGVTAHSNRGGSWVWHLAIDGEQQTASLNAIEIEAGATYEWTFQQTTEN